MKWCQPHWDALREGVKARGLWQFVPESGEEAFDNAVLELQGHGTTFDPLTGAMWQLTNDILRNVASSQGPGASIACLGDPTWCPMCEVQASWDWWDDPTKNTEGEKRPEAAADAQAWIDRKLDAAVRYAKEQGFLR